MYRKTCPAEPGAAVSQLFQQVGIPYGALNLCGWTVLRGRPELARGASRGRTRRRHHPGHVREGGGRPTSLEGEGRPAGDAASSGTTGVPPKEPRVRACRAASHPSPRRTIVAHHHHQPSSITRRSAPQTSGGRLTCLRGGGPTPMLRCWEGGDGSSTTRFRKK